MAQTKTEIAALLREAGLAPNKRFGQHFLIDGNLMQRLVAAGDPGRRDVVLEVGVGTGSLTEALLERAGHVVAVEVDRGLYGLAYERLGAVENVSLLHVDVLETKSRTSAQVLTAVRQACDRLGGPAMLVANLPFNIASPLIVDLALCDLPLNRLCFTVQREVATRISAGPNGKDFGPLSVVLQAAGEIRFITAVPKQAFWPVPAVESTLLRIDLAADRRERLEALRNLNRVVRACFLHRRKTLAHNLRYAFPEAAASIAETGRWDLTRRPENLSVDEWIALAAEVP